MPVLLGLFPMKSDSRENDQWERSGTRTFGAAFTTDADENFARSNLGGSLIINYPHPTDFGQVVAEIAVTQQEEISKFVNPLNPADGNTGVECFWWEVIITYSYWDPLAHTATGNPVDQPPDVSFDWAVFEQAADVAYMPGTTTLVPVCNSAGDPFDPPVTRDQLRGILRVAWNSLTFDPAAFFIYGNFINSDVWNGFPSYSVKFSPPKMPQRLYSQFMAQNYYRLEAEFVFNPNDGGWNPKPIDRGYRVNDGSGNLSKIVDVNGQPVSQPALLNGSGGLLTTLSDFVQMEFQVYQDTAFAAAFPNLNNLFA